MAGGTGDGKRLSEPQVVGAEFPGSGKGLEALLAWIEHDDARLKLLRVEPGQSMSFTGAVDISFDEICRVLAGDDCEVTVHGASGDLLLTLYLETAAAAKLWLDGLNAVARGGKPRSPAGQRKGNPGSNLANLRKLVEKQESQVRMMEELNKKKEHQILQMHGRFEEALGTLHSGQEMYAQQLVVLDRYQIEIAELKGDVRVDPVESSAPAAATGTAASTSRARAPPPPPPPEDETSGEEPDIEGDANYEEIEDLEQMLGNMQAMLAQLEGLPNV